MRDGAVRRNGGIVDEFTVKIELNIDGLVAGVEVASLGAEMPVVLAHHGRGFDMGAKPMQSKGSTALQRAATDGRIDLEQRDVRALTEYLTVIPHGGDTYEVVSQSGSSYSVDAREGHCTCPDYQRREPEGGCKHSRRVRFETGREAIPDWVDPTAIPDDFAAHVDATPVTGVATDGGTPLEGPTGVDGDGDDGDDDGVETCLCDHHDDLGCWEHFHLDESA